MSFEASAAMFGIKGLKARERMVLSCLAHHLNKNSGLCFPSIKTIAGELECTERTVHAAIAGLKAKNRITVLEKGRPGKSSRYALNLEESPNNTAPVELNVVQVSTVNNSGINLNDLPSNKEVEEGNESGKTSVLTHIEQKLNQKTAEELTKDSTDIKGNKKDAGQLSSSNLTALPTTKNTVLCDIWCQAVTNTGKTATATALEGRMLRTLVGKLGYENTCTLIPYVVNNWTNFALQCRSEAAAFSLPTRPSIGFFLKYRDIAFDMLKKSHSTKAATSMCKVTSVASVVAAAPQLPLTVILAQMHKAKITAENAAYEESQGDL